MNNNNNKPVYDSETPVTFFFLTTLKVCWQTITSVWVVGVQKQENCRQAERASERASERAREMGGERERELVQMWRLVTLVMKMSRMGVWTVSCGRLFQSSTILGKTGRGTAC